MTVKLAKWAVFSVLLALTPLAFAYIQSGGRGRVRGLDQLLLNGELLLVAAAISAAAVGDLIGSGKSRMVPKIFVAGLSVLILGLASMQFADIPSAQATPGFDPAFIASASKWFFVFSVVAGAGCVALGED